MGGVVFHLGALHSLGFSLLKIKRACQGQKGRRVLLTMLFGRAACWTRILEPGGTSLSSSVTRLGRKEKHFMLDWELPLGFGQVNLRH